MDAHDIHDIPESSRLDADEQRGEAAEFPGRVAIAMAAIALCYAAWFLQLPGAADWIGRVQRIAPRLSVMGLGFFTALLLQGCWIKNRTLLMCAIVAGVGMLWLQNSAGQFEIVRLDAEAINSNMVKTRAWVPLGGRIYFHAPVATLSSGVAMLLIRFECAMLAAVFLGTWIGRGAWSAWHFVTLLMFGAVCDVWVNWFHVAETATPNDWAAALRLPFCPSVGGLAGGPGFLDVVFISAAFESARGFRMHTLSLVLGALAGYCSGSFLGLEPSPAWTHLSMPLLAFGVLAAAWPDLKLDSNAVGKMFLAVALLIFALISFVTIQNKLSPRQERRYYEEERHVRELARSVSKFGKGFAFNFRRELADG